MTVTRTENSWVTREFRSSELLASPVGCKWAQWWAHPPGAQQGVRDFHGNTVQLSMHNGRLIGLNQWETSNQEVVIFLPAQPGHIFIKYIHIHIYMSQNNKGIMKFEDSSNWSRSSHQRLREYYLLLWQFSSIVFLYFSLSERKATLHTKHLIYIAESDVNFFSTLAQVSLPWFLGF